jgi:preprotein translocase subunit SecA
MNKQREAVYGLRRRILEGKDTRDHVVALSQEILDWYLGSYCNEKLDADAWSHDGLQGALKETFGLDVPLAELKALGRGEMAGALGGMIDRRYEDKERQVGPELMVFYQRMIMLQIVDAQWKDHLYGLDHLKEGIGLRSYGQRDPLVEYKKESFNMFQALMDRIDEEILRWVYLYQPVPVQDEPAAQQAASREPRRKTAEAQGPLAASRSLPRNLVMNDPADAPSAFARAERAEAKGGMGDVQTVRREGPKVGRNDPCPCGSGRKYKKCHGAS